jgi:gliding motility-associated-like protein
LKYFLQYKYPVLILCASLFLNYVQAQNAFTENKGQWDKQVLFRANIGGHAFFLTRDGNVVQMNNVEDMEEIAAYYHGHIHDSTVIKKISQRKSPPVLRAHAYSVKLMECNKDASVIKEKPMQGYENFFIGNDPSKWASECRSYQSVTYREIYSGIDLRYYMVGDHLKYDFIVKPGGRADRIKLHYEGADQLKLSNRVLIVQTSCGNMTEKEPLTYQFINERKEKIRCNYRLKGNTLSFDVGSYDRQNQLIIDPAMVFSSFSGSTTDNWGFTATPGPDGSMFGGGIAGSIGFPTTLGAFQVQGAGPDANNAPPSDVTIIKLSPNGRNRIYATYIGGNGFEQPHSLIADAAGNLVIAGRTNSGSSFPGTLLGTGGGYDIFVAKLNATGTALIGALKIGGSLNDGVNISPNRFGGPGTLLRNYGDDGRSEVILDDENNILLASCTQSNNFFVRNPFQLQYNGAQDGVLIKIDENASDVIWSSYLGGAGNDAAFVLTCANETSEIYVAGGTTSADFPGIGAGAIRSSYQGGLADGFVTRLKDNGGDATIIRSTYLGTDQTDLVYGVQLDKSGFPYVMGTTTGSWEIINAPYSIPNTRQFIAKLKPDLGGFVYSTTFGSQGAFEPNISPVAFLVDNCENVYVSGWGGRANLFANPPYPFGGTAGMPLTSDAFQSETDGSDFYFFVLKKNASDILYGGYFGQRGGRGGRDHVDGGTSRFDAQGVIYQAVCANCKGVASDQPLQEDYLTTGGVFGKDNLATNGAGCNLGMIKIRFDFTGVDVNLRTLNTKRLNFCIPATIQFEESLKLAKEYIWIWGDGSKNDTTSQNRITHTFLNEGYFNIKVIGIDQNTCNVRDTDSFTIRVTTDSVAIRYKAVRKPPCDSLIYEFTNLSDKLTSKPDFGARSFVWKWGDGSPDDTIPGFDPNPVIHKFPGAGTYKVRLVLVDTNFCNGGDSSTDIELKVATIIRAGFVVNNGCIPFSPAIRDTSFGAFTYKWITSDGQQSQLASPVFLFTNPGTYTIKQYIYNQTSCNLIDSTEREIQVFSPPSASFTYAPFPSKENTPTRFTSTTTPDVIGWEWNFGDEQSTLEKNPTHQYVGTGIYNVCQIVTDIRSCKDTLCQPVEALIATLQDVPSAFTPNGDGVNDIFMVRGFGVSKMSLRIFNRQGLLLFESKNQNIGWDGTYKGNPQPMDAYVWTLEIEYFTGEKLRRRGDVTLIR